MLPPVTPARIATAKVAGLANVEAAALACREAGLPFYVACALLTKESPTQDGTITGGANIYGHDHGAVHTITGDLEVTPANFLELLTRVMNGETSNGVGPCQITYAGARVNGHRDGGYFTAMAAAGLLPWEPGDNMVFGFRILARNYARVGQWAGAFAMYNGGPTPNRDALAYGRDGADRVVTWAKRLGIR